MDPISLLASLGVSGQVIAYVSAAITIATVITKLLPKPNANGAYKVVYDIVTRIANLTVAPSDVHTVPSVLPAPSATPPTAAIAMILAASLALSACAAGGAATGGTLLGTIASGIGLSSQVVQAGQTVCTLDGLYVALFNPVADPITVTGQSAAAVQGFCNAWKPGATPVAAPPTAAVQAATVTVPTAS